MLMNKNSCIFLGILIYFIFILKLNVKKYSWHLSMEIIVRELEELSFEQFSVNYQQIMKANVFFSQLISIKDVLENVLVRCFRNNAKTSYFHILCRLFVVYKNINVAESLISLEISGQRMTSWKTQPLRQVPAYYENSAIYRYFFQLFSPFSKQYFFPSQIFRLKCRIILYHQRLEIEISITLYKYIYIYTIYANLFQ